MYSHDNFLKNDKDVRYKAERTLVLSEGQLVSA